MGKYRFRSGCLVLSRDESHQIVDNLRLISLPVNKSAAMLLAEMPHVLTGEELSFLQQLHSLSFLISEEEDRLAQRFIAYFRPPLPCGEHKSII